MVLLICSSRMDVTTARLALPEVVLELGCNQCCSRTQRYPGSAVGYLQRLDLWVLTARMQEVSVTVCCRSTTGLNVAIMLLLGYGRSVILSLKPDAGAAAPLDYFSVLGECCYCCIAMLYDNPDWQDAMIAYIKDAWSCEKPQCFGHGYTYNYGSLGQILATDTNSAEVSRLAVCTTDPVVGWLKAAAYAAQSCCSVVGIQGGRSGPDFSLFLDVYVSRKLVSSASRSMNSSFFRKLGLWLAFRFKAVLAA